MHISFTINWVELFVFLILFPFAFEPIYGKFSHSSSSQWFPDLTPLVVVLVCWLIALGLLIGHFL